MRVLCVILHVKCLVCVSCIACVAVDLDYGDWLTKVRTRPWPRPTEPAIAMGENPLCVCQRPITGYTWCCAVYGAQDNLKILLLPESWLVSSVLSVALPQYYQIVYIQFQFNTSSALDESDPLYNKNPDVDEKVHVLVCVLSSSNDLDGMDKVIEKMKNIRLAARDLGQKTCLHNTISLLCNSILLVYWFCRNSFI